MTGGEDEQSMARARLGEEERRDCTLGMRVTAAEAEALRSLLTDAYKRSCLARQGSPAASPQMKRKIPPLS